MRKAVFALAVLVFASALTAASEPGGYGVLSWGDPVPEGWKPVPVDAFLRLPTFVDPGDDLRFDGVSLERAEYEFRDGAFARAVLYFRGESAFKELKKTLKERFDARGKAVRPILCRETVHWVGEVTFANLNLVNENDESLLLLCPAADEADAEAYANWELERKIGNRLCKCPGLIRMAEDVISALERDQSEVELAMEIGYGGIEGDGSCIGTGLGQEKRALSSRGSELKMRLENARAMKRKLEEECAKASAQMQQLRAFVAKRWAEVARRSDQETE